MKIIQPETKLYLPMNEGSGTTAYDYSGNSNNGVITGATYDKIVDGGYALNFNGSGDEVVIPTISTVKTIVFWMNTNSDISSSSSLSALFGRDSSQYILYTGSVTGAISNEVFTFQCSGNKHMYWTNSQMGTLSANQWYHIAFTFPTTTTGFLYINGVLVGEANYYGSPVVPTFTNLAIGSRGGSVYFAGQMNNWLILDKDFSIEEIRTHMRTTYVI